jgi:hypothetical protein
MAGLAPTTTLCAAGVELMVGQGPPYARSGRAIGTGVACSCESPIPIPNPAIPGSTASCGSRSVFIDARALPTQQILNPLRRSA